MNSIQFKNPEQIINMGGPWIGQLYFNDKYINDNIVIKNYIEKDNYVYFIQYFLISNKQKDNFFSVIKLNTSNLKVTVSNEKFEKIYIEDIKNEVLYYYEGFHNKLPTKKILLTF
ncbi:hypothetical protein ACFO4P_12070 [Epilithonimonas pallida]|uniref:Uncharacterized protein n=1 Tax=Epilithonimonas pallida TaxID=373671 RepID=A0ABY1R9T6_9FLAO|nr:hypothetical protein [Epilithonimonas pallida]SMP97252.1 hypothetical protein SAMN05421679_1129 [Epilithonimonas pallida]